MTWEPSAVDAVLMELARASAALERIAVALEAWEPGETTEPCSHPAEKRDDRSTMGRPMWRCTVCGFTVGASEGEIWP